MIMLPQSPHDILEGVISLVCNFLFDGFTKLCLESLLAFLLHLDLPIFFFLTAGILAVIMLTDGVRQTSLHALFTEIF